MLAGISRWLSTNPAIEKPELPASRGSLTIAHVYALDDPAQYGRAVEEWARCVWAAYAEHQSLARRWIDVAAARGRRT